MVVPAWASQWRNPGLCIELCFELCRRVSLALFLQPLRGSCLEPSQSDAFLIQLVPIDQLSRLHPACHTYLCHPYRYQLGQLNPYFKLLEVEAAVLGSELSSFTSSITHSIIPVNFVRFWHGQPAYLPQDKDRSNLLINSSGKTSNVNQSPPRYLHWNEKHYPATGWFYNI